MTTITSINIGNIVSLSDGTEWRVLIPDAPKAKSWPNNCSVILEKKQGPLEVWSHKIIRTGPDDYVRVMRSGGLP